MSLTGKKGAGIPLILLHDSEGSIVTIEMKNGYTLRGLLDDTQDTMNCTLKKVTRIDPEGRESFAELMYVRGSQMRFIVLPDMLKKAPFFSRIKLYRQFKGHAVFGAVAQAKLGLTPTGPAGLGVLKTGGGDFSGGGDGGGSGKICFDFQKGRCTRGNCLFRHVVEGADGGSGTGGGSGKICFDFQKGRCTRGNCTFRHTMEGYGGAPTGSQGYGGAFGGNQGYGGSFGGNLGYGGAQTGGVGYDGGSQGYGGPR